MKILHVYKAYLPDSQGGVEQTIRQITLETSKLNCTNRILYLSKNPLSSPHSEAGAESFPFRLNFEIASTGFSWSAIAGFRQLAQWADVLHYHFPWPFADILHFLSRTKKPSLITYHSDIVRQKNLLKLYTPLQNAFLKSINKIVATSPNYLTTSSTLQHFQDKTTVIPIGLQKSSYPIPEHTLLKHWQNKLGNRFFLFVGVIRYYKGLHILLEACKNTAFPVVIVGAGPIEKELKQRAGELNLENIHFLGFLSEADKVALLQLCTAVIFPSHLRSEAFGVSLLEGAMFAKPMISTEIGTGTSYINIHQETGVVVPSSNPQALRNAMDYIWQNPDIAEQMGKNAYQRYQSHFTAEKMARAYLKIYAELIGEEV